MKLQVGVKLLITDKQGRFLFIKRAASFGEGDQAWDIPGGRIKENENLEDALAREVLEETGLTMDPTVKLLAAQDIFVPAKDLHVVRLTYQGRAGGQIKLSDEHSSYEWMGLAEALGSNLDTYLLNVLKA